MSNIYFDLTREFNAHGPVVMLASGQAVVYYRLAIMSKDGDWILRETDEACRRVLDVLVEHGASYRLSAPLDPRWLRGGWSSHFEFLDPQQRRIRCDFFSRPPRVARAAIENLFAQATDPLHVISLEELVQMKRTQRAKDYAVIGELARLLPPAREIEVTTDPDRILALVGDHGDGSDRACVRAAREGRGVEAVELALVVEMRGQRLADQHRVRAYERSAAPYLAEFLTLGLDRLPLREAHVAACSLAERLLPSELPDTGDADADAK